MNRRAIAVWLALALWLGGISTALAQDPTAAIEELKKEMKELRKEVAEKDKKIEDLEQRLDAVQKTVNAAPVKAPVKTATVKPKPTTPEATGEKVVKAGQGPKETAGAEAALDEAVKALQEKAAQASQAQKKEIPPPAGEKPSSWSIEGGRSAAGGRIKNCFGAGCHES